MPMINELFILILSLGAFIIGLPLLKPKLELEEIEIESEFNY